MQMRYNNFLFPANSLTPSYEAQVVLDDSGQPHTLKQKVSVTGRLAGSGQNNLMLMESVMLTALAATNGDLVFVGDDGTQASISLLSSGSYDGVQISSVRTGSELGAEYATIRTFAFDAEVSRPFPSGSPVRILKWGEKVAMWGGGAKRIGRNAINGPPQIQLVFPATVYMASQSGSAEGLLDYPSPPLPLWPGDLAEGNPRIERVGPQRRGTTGNTNFGITWDYQFLSATPFFGGPTYQPIGV